MIRNRIKPRRPTAGGRIVAHEVESVDWAAYPPAFCFQHMVAGYSVADCNQKDKAALSDAMWRRSQLTWRELRSAPPHGLGPEKIRQVNRSRPVTITDDVVLLAFRFSGLKAMVGFQDGRIFHVIWLDHDFTVYSH